MSAYKPVVIKEELYKKLESLKTKSNRSFSDVMDNILEENIKIVEENRILIEENKKLTDVLEEKGKNFFSNIIKRWYYVNRRRFTKY